MTDHNDHETVLADLTGNPKNPRSPWKAEQVEPFRESLRRFGDLGGIVRNRTTGQLVGGHKRVEVFARSADVQIVTTEQPRDAQGTVAHGHVIVEGNRFGYREVEWPADLEAAANLAANRWGAEWEWSLVSETLQGITDAELLALTGFPAHELDNLIAADWTPAAVGTLNDPIEHAHAVKLTDQEFALLEQVTAHMHTLTRAAGDEGTLSAGQIIAHLCRRYLDAA